MILLSTDRSEHQWWKTGSIIYAKEQKPVLLYVAAFMFIQTKELQITKSAFPDKSFLSL